MHVLSACYAHYEHTRGIKGYVTYYLACYVRLQVQNMSYYMGLQVQNMLGCHSENMDGANSQTGGKNSSGTFVPIAFISFGMFNIFLTQV